MLSIEPAKRNWWITNGDDGLCLGSVITDKYSGTDRRLPNNKRQSVFRLHFAGSELPPTDERVSEPGGGRESLATEGTDARS